MVSIGIGGNIGSGKTTVVKELTKFYQKDGLEVKLIDADKIAWELYKPLSKIYEKIVKTFGRDILDKKGEIDRKKLGKIVFNNKAKLRRLNKIIHPELVSQINQELRKNGKKIKLLDAALLFFWEKKIAVTHRILVKALIKQKVARMTKRGYNSNEVKARLKQQMKETEMEKTADFVINNNGSSRELKKKIKALYEIITNK